MNDSQVSHMLDAWIAEVNHRQSNAEMRERTSALFAAMNAMETPAAMVVAGDQDVAAQQNRLYDAQKKYGASSDEAIKLMLEAPMTGLMHVSDMARISANWNPVLLTNSEANSIAYQNYVTKLTRFPLVELNYASTEEIHRQSSNWDDLINSIADTFVGIEGSNKDQIVTGLKNLAQAASSTMSTTQKTSLFCQNAINSADKVYSYYLYNSTCTFKEEKTKGFDTKQNDFYVMKVKLTLKMPLWTYANVAKLIAQTDASLDDWLNNNSTSLEGTKPIPALHG